jgi:hypothetical protein
VGRAVWVLIGPLTYIEVRDLYCLELYLHLYMLALCSLNYVFVNIVIIIIIITTIIIYIIIIISNFVTYSDARKLDRIRWTFVAHFIRHDYVSYENFLTYLKLCIL